RGGNGGQAAFERFDSARELPLAGRPATDAIDPNRTFAARIAPPHSGRWVSPHAVENASTRRNRHTTDVRLYSPWIAGPGEAAFSWNQVLAAAARAWGAECITGRRVRIFSS